jgi:hypothetical protein
MLILWRHIEYYLVNFESNIQSFQLYKNDFYSVENLNDLQQNARRAGQSNSIIFFFNLTLDSS